MPIQHHVGPGHGILSAQGFKQRRPVRIATLDAVRQRVLVKMRFKIGPVRFRGFKRMLRLVSEGDYTGAAAAMRDSIWYGQVKHRAVRLVQMMLTGIDV